MRIQVHIIYNENLLVRYQVERTFSTCSKSIKHTDGKSLKYNYKISITDVIVTDIFNRQLWCVWRIVYVVVSLSLCCFRPSYKHAVAGTSSVVGKNFQIFLSAANTRKQQASSSSSSSSCRFFFSETYICIIYCII